MLTNPVTVIIPASVITPQWAPVERTLSRRPASPAAGGSVCTSDWGGGPVASADTVVLGGGVSVGQGVGEGPGDAVFVGEGVDVTAEVESGVGVEVAEGRGVRVRVGLGVEVAVGLGVEVGVG